MDLEYIRSIDSQHMWDTLVEFPAQWEEAMEISRGFELTVDKDRIRNICFVGMGGSAIGAEIIKGYCYHTCPVPIQVIRHYNLPQWVNEQTLVIGCSFSGGTEETISALQDAQKKGAQTICVTSGGPLLLEAVREEFDYFKIPGGMPPRAALGYIFISLFRVFEQLDLIEEGEEALEETLQFLTEYTDLLSDPGDNEALHLATDVNHTLPIIYSDATMMAPVNLRWRNQFEENAKTLAYGNLFPEMSHNEIVGWEHIAHLTGRLSVIKLTDQEDDQRVQRRMEVVDALISDQLSSVHLLKTRGKSRLTRMFSLVLLADWTSFYMAMINETDPSPVTKIDLLKRRLAEA